MKGVAKKSVSSGLMFPKFSNPFKCKGHGTRTMRVVVAIRGHLMINHINYGWYFMVWASVVSNKDHHHQHHCHQQTMTWAQTNKASHAWILETKSHFVSSGLCTFCFCSKSETRRTWNKLKSKQTGVWQEQSKQKWHKACSKTLFFGVTASHLKPGHQAFATVVIGEQCKLLH